MTRESELELVKKAGRRLRTEHLDVRALDSLFSHARVAIVVGKLGHSVVERNKLRRRLRELARVGLIPRIAGKDLVIRALPAAYNASFAELKVEMETLGVQLAVKGS